METCIFQRAGGIRRRCYLRGGADTLTLRGEDCRYCGAFHSISENFVLDD